PSRLNARNSTFSNLVEEKSTVYELIKNEQMSRLEKQKHCGCPPKGVKAITNLDGKEDKQCTARTYQLGTEVIYSCLAGHIKVDGQERLSCELLDGQATWVGESLLHAGEPLRCESKLDFI